MAGRKNSPNHGMWKGKKPAASKDFVAGSEHQREALRKSHESHRRKLALYKSLRDAAMALRDMPSQANPDESNGVAVIDGMYREAAAGCPKCATFLANLMGEMVEKVDVQNLPIIRDDVPRAPDPAPAPPPSNE